MIGQDASLFNEASGQGRRGEVTRQSENEADEGAPLFRYSSVTRALRAFLSLPACWRRGQKKNEKKNGKKISRKYRHRNKDSKTRYP